MEIFRKYPDALYDSRTYVDLSSGADSQHSLGGARLNTALGVSPPDSPRTLRKDLQLYEELLANLHSKMEDPLADKVSSGCFRKFTNSNMNST